MLRKQRLWDNLSLPFPDFSDLMSVEPMINKTKIKNLAFLLFLLLLLLLVYETNVRAT